MTSSAADARPASAGRRIHQVTAERLQFNPIVTPELDDSIGTNINGPSLIRAPEWLASAPGRYLLYFAHHRGTFIRLAYADELAGPWAIYRPGTLQLEASGFINHIASPDVHVDDQYHEVRMYFHGLMSAEGHVQGSRVARSANGVDFEVVPELLMNRPYLRAFGWDGQVYGLTMSGNRPAAIWRSPDGLTPFEHLPWPAPELPSRTEAYQIDKAGKWPAPLPFRCRHAAVQRIGSELLVLYSMAEDNPERLVYSVLDLAPPWDQWRGTDPADLLAPETEWEGGNLPLLPSTTGQVNEPVRQLRDPGIFTDLDGSRYVLYSTAGESGLGIARLHVELG